MEGHANNLSADARKRPPEEDSCDLQVEKYLWSTTSSSVLRHPGLDWYQEGWSWWGGFWQEELRICADRYVGSVGNRVVLKSLFVCFKYYLHLDLDI